MWSPPCAWHKRGMLGCVKVPGALPLSSLGPHKMPSKTHKEVRPKRIRVLQEPLLVPVRVIEALAVLVTKVPPPARLTTLPGGFVEGTISGLPLPRCQSGIISLSSPEEHKDRLTDWFAGKIRETQRDTTICWVSLMQSHVSFSLHTTPRSAGKHKGNKGPLRETHAGLPPGDEGEEPLLRLDFHLGMG